MKNIYGFYDLKAIYSEESSKPEGWDEAWKVGTNATVYWNDSWQYVQGVPAPI